MSKPVRATYNSEGKGWFSVYLPKKKVIKLINIIEAQPQL